MFGSPFDGSRTVRLVLPSDLAQLSPVEILQVQGMSKLFREQRGALEREIGARFEESTDGSSPEPRWLVGPFECNPAIAASGRRACCGRFYKSYWKLSPRFGPNSVSVTNSLATRT